MFSRLRNSSVFKRASKWSKDQWEFKPDVEKYFVGDWKSRSTAALSDSGHFLFEVAIMYGDFVLIDRLTYSLLGGQYKTGDVIIAVNPYDPQKTVCKRIAATEGEVILLTKDPSKKSGTSSQGISVTRLPVPHTLDSSPVERTDLSISKSGSADTAEVLIKDDKIAVIMQSSDTNLQSHKQNISSSAIVKETGSPEQDSVDGSITAVKSTRRNKKVASNVILKSTDPVEVTGLYYDYFVIPEGHVWLAGDNVANSTDSRFYGPVPMGLLRGKVCYKVHALPPSLEPVVSSTDMLYRSGPQYAAIFSNRKTFTVTKEVVENLVSDSVDSEKSSKKIEEKSSS